MVHKIKGVLLGPDTYITISTLVKIISILLPVLAGYILILHRLARIESKVVQAVALRWTSVDDKHFMEDLCEENGLSMVEHRSVTDWNRIQGVVSAQTN